ncbi:hypothetical protein [Massilia sp. UBA6681]|uniref:hypothetical protein n=1 Tax=Massilia sp. UBA6681 TaxID=1946839 RepID=UPI0025BAD5ED|nr:hypothetical protein [Massilia sp. UBA6681]
MHQAARLKDAVIVIATALIWTLVVIAFSTTMGSRPLRIYDWGPPVFACLLTLLVMLKDRFTGGEAR